MIQLFMRTQKYIIKIHILVLSFGKKQLYLNEYIATTRYMIAQDKAVDRKPKRSPNLKRKQSKSIEEGSGASPRVFNTKKNPNENLSPRMSTPDRVRLGRVLHWVPK